MADRRDEEAPAPEDAHAEDPPGLHPGHTPGNGAEAPEDPSSSPSEDAEAPEPEAADDAPAQPTPPADPTSSPAEPAALVFPTDEELDRRAVSSVQAGSPADTERRLELPDALGAPGQGTHADDEPPFVLPPVVAPDRPPPPGPVDDQRARGGRGALVGAAVALLAAAGLAAALLGGAGSGDPVATSAATATSTAPPTTSAQATTAETNAGGATTTTTTPAPLAGPPPEDVLVASDLPDRVLALLPRPARAAGRADALGAACAGEASAAVVLGRIGTAPCRLTTVARATVDVTVLLAPGGGCTTLEEARRLAAAARGADQPGGRPDGLAAVAVRRTPGSACVPVTRETLTSGRHPLATVAVLATTPEQRASARVRALARDLEAAVAEAPVVELVLTQPVG